MNQSDGDADFWQALRDQARAKRARNVESSTRALTLLKIPWSWADRDSNHILIEADSAVFDFWPSTGSWTIRGSNEFRRGIKTLVQHLRDNSVTFDNKLPMAHLSKWTVILAEQTHESD